MAPTNKKAPGDSWAQIARTRPVHLENELNRNNYGDQMVARNLIDQQQQALEFNRYSQSNVQVYATNKREVVRIELVSLERGCPSLRIGHNVRLTGEANNHVSHVSSVIEYGNRNLLLKLLNSSLFHSSPGVKRANDGDSLGRFKLSFNQSDVVHLRRSEAIQRCESNPRLMALLFPKSPKSRKRSHPKIDVSIKKIDQLCNHMDDGQRKAVYRILRAEHRAAAYVLLGPPGTGKTLTIVECVRLILQLPLVSAKQAKVLVCSSTNECVDMLAKVILRVCSDVQLKQRELIRLTTATRLNNGQVDGELAKIALTDRQFDRQTFFKSRVVVTTCSQASTIGHRVGSASFDYVIVDEAGHMLESEVLLALQLLHDEGMVLLAGDPKQLGPIVRANRSSKPWSSSSSSSSSSAGAVDRSILERMLEIAPYKPITNNPKNKDTTSILYNDNYITMLRVCYRTNGQLMAIPNVLLYHNQVLCRRPIKLELLALLNSKNPSMFSPTTGLARSDNENSSLFNPNEVEKVCKLMLHFYNNNIRPEQVGILTPYARQRDMIVNGLGCRKLDLCKVGTVNEFQGDEREITIISLVINRNCKFVSNERLFCTAITRAQDMRIIVGNPQALKKSIWQQVIDNSKQI